MKSSGSRSWEADLDQGAAERRFVDANRTAVELRKLTHHRQADALAADALVEPGATVEDAVALCDGDARAIVLDDEAQTVASRGGIGEAFGREPHLATAPLERVVQQIAGDLGQIFPVAAEETQRRTHELAVDVALDVDLEQRRAQRFERGAYIDRCGTEAGAAGSSCPLELIFDDVVHPPDLLVELFRDCKLATIRAAEQVTHDRERRLEAVREIAQRVAIASQSLPLTAQQGIEIRGHAEQLARILCPQLRHAPRFDLLDLMFDSPQRSQQPPQQERERADQQKHQTRE